MMHIETYAAREMLVMLVADTLAGELKISLLSQDTVTLVVPGGTTPGPIFDALCAADLEWDRVRVMLSDERWVPEDHTRSNTALVRQRLMVDRAGAAQFFPFYIDGLTPPEAAEQLSVKLTDDLPLSVMLLGMGADMHTASLFPGAKDLAEALAPGAPNLVPIEVAGQEPRISLSGPVLASAMSKHLVIFGDEKREALEQAQSSSTEEAPIRVALDGITVHWAE